MHPLRKKQIIAFVVSIVISANFLFSLTFPVLAEILETPDQQTSFFLSPDKELFLDPDFLYLDVGLNSGIRQINAIKLSLSFATGSLELIASSTNNSICSLVAVNQIKNSSGLYDLECGLTPEIYDNQILTRLIFKKLKPGFAKLTINNNSAILAHDGLGTNLLNNREIHNIFIVK